jgi:hypothetical protein
VRVSGQCGIPFTFGTLRPVVLLPEESKAWPERRLRAVLIHELTHVRRKESLLNCLAACACALLWFLPVLWVSYSLMRQEAEASSDRAVLRHGISRTDYASDLVELAHGGRGVALAGGAAVALARRRNVRDRVVRILAWRRGTASRSLRAAGVAVTLAFLCVLPVLASSGAALVGDRPLVGAWISPESLRCRRIIWTADGRVIEYTLLDSDVPSGVGRYTIEKKWMDEQGSTWYQVKARVSPPPFRERIAWKNLYLIRVSPSGTSLEYDVSWFLDFLDTLTLGDDTVFLRESPR